MVVAAAFAATFAVWAVVLILLIRHRSRLHDRRSLTGEVSGTAGVPTV